MAKFERYEELKIWQMGVALVKTVYELTMEHDLSKDFGLKGQIRRSAISIPSNIAEGFERNGNREFIQFLYIAKGSAGELSTQLYIAHELNYIDKVQYSTLQSELTKLRSMIYNFIIYLKRSGYEGNKYNTTQTNEPTVDYTENWKSDPKINF